MRLLESNRTTDHQGLATPTSGAGAAKYLPQVPITFDRYHLMQNLNYAMDQVRHAEQTSP